MEKDMINFVDECSKYMSLSEVEVKALNPLIWAYIGDAVYEVFVRTHVISECKARKSNDLHRQSITFVKAKAQSDFLEGLLPTLTEEELNIVRRGRNTKSYHTAKNADVADYRRATAFEALIGYLYLLKRLDRLQEIMDFIFSK